MTTQCIITFFLKWHKTGKNSILGKPTHMCYTFGSERDQPLGCVVSTSSECPFNDSVFWSLFGGEKDFRWFQIYLYFYKITLNTELSFQSYHLFHKCAKNPNRSKFRLDPSRIWPYNQLTSCVNCVKFQCWCHTRNVCYLLYNSSFSLPLYRSLILLKSVSWQNWGGFYVG